MPVYVEGNNQKVKNDYNQNSYTIKGINKRNNNIWEKEKKTFVNINKLYISPHRAVTSYIIPKKKLGTSSPSKSYWTEYFKSFVKLHET